MLPKERLRECYLKKDFPFRESRIPLAKSSWRRKRESRKTNKKKSIKKVQKEKEERERKKEKGEEERLEENQQSA